MRGLPRPLYDLDASERSLGWRDWAPWLFFAGAVGGVLWSTWALSVPGTHFIATLFIPVAAAAFAFAWLVASVAFATDRRPPRRRLVAWLLTPLLAVSAYPFVVSELPVRIRLELSRGALDDLARDVSLGRRAPPDDGRVGLYSIRHSERLTHGFAFLIEGAGFIEPCGLAYASRGAPEPWGATEVWHIDGPWYAWCQEF